MRAAFACLLSVAACGRVSFDSLASDDGGSDAIGDPGVVTIAGGAEPGTDDGVGSAAQFDNPVNVAVGPDDTIYVIDFGSGRVRAVTPEGIVTTVTTQLLRSETFGLAVTAAGTIYATDDGGTLYQVDRATGNATTLAMGLGGQARGILPISATQIAIASWTPPGIVLVNPTTGAITPLVGGTTGYAEGNGAAAQFRNPTDLVRFPDGRIAVTDQENMRIRLVSLAGDTSLYAGSGVDGFMDGPAAAAAFSIPTGLAIARDGSIYVSDRFNRRIRKITPGGEVSTIAGNGNAGFVDNVDPLQAEFFAMEGIALSNDERYLYIADGSGALDGMLYNRVRRLGL